MLSTVQGLKVYLSEVIENNEASFPPRLMADHLFPFGCYPLILSTVLSGFSVVSSNSVIFEL